MYRIDDKAEAIKEVQKLLNLNQTGLFDKKTKDAVLNVQSKYKLEETGVVDYQTFTLITEDYRNEKNNKWDSDYLFNPRFPYVIGDIGDNVLKINEAMEIVLADFSYEETIPKGKYLGVDTIKGVRFLRKIFNMNESDEIDEALMSRIMKEREHIEIKSKRT
jgi:hypothetical protein